MTITENSKPIAKSDDAAKDFIRLTLGKGFTRGFDVDSVYCEVENGKVRWTLIEFLKCDTVSPEVSHPRFYWNGTTANRKKFLSLWAMCLSLRRPNVDSRLLLINYQDEQSKVKILEVEAATDEAISTLDKTMSFDEWKQWFSNFNATKVGATWDVLKLIQEKKLEAPVNTPDAEFDVDQGSV